MKMKMQYLAHSLSLTLSFYLSFYFCLSHSCYLSFSFSHSLYLSVSILHLSYFYDMVFDRRASNLTKTILDFHARVSIPQSVQILKVCLFLLLGECSK